VNIGNKTVQTRSLYAS